MADQADLASPNGGIETTEAGAVTGDLTLLTDGSGSSTTVRVKYRDAEDEYEVVGSPIDGEHSATTVASWLGSQTGEQDSLGNESPVNLRGYASS